jgi:hypothetical protein
VTPLVVGVDRTGPAAPFFAAAVGCGWNLNGTIENPDSGTMVNDDFGAGVVAGVGNCLVGGSARGVAMKVGVSTGGGLRGTPLVRLACRVVVTKTVGRLFGVAGAAVSVT